MIDIYYISNLSLIIYRYSLLDGLKKASLSLNDTSASFSMRDTNSAHVGIS